MKTAFILFTVLMSTLVFTTSAQDKKSVDTIRKDTIRPEAITPDNDVIFTAVEEQPGFPGGDEARMKFLQDNLVYPKKAKRDRIQGRVFVTYVVEKDGSISNIKVLRGIGGGCDEEAVRVIRLMPKWIPGKHEGQPVRVQFNVPIKFTLTTTH
jgi:periplasmic protein TonB